MLEPEGRHLLLDALRPPTGYTFDRAIGTTFSLDLAALLTAPVGFALLDRETTDGRVTTDPVALLEAVRRNADRIDMFCQAGLIGLPADYRPIVSYLESSIHEVTAPHAGAIFHPKVWLIRYRRADDAVGDDGPAQRYRLLCLSRNLTFDRSWDTVLRLEGEPSAARDERNEPLARFLRSLRSMAREPLEPGLADELGMLADEVLRVRFEPPPGFDELAFWPLGIDRRRSTWPFDTRIDRMLIVSPFLSPDGLERFARPRSDGRDTLISRPESFDALGATALRRFGGTFTLSGDSVGVEEATDVEEPADADRRDVVVDESLAERPGIELRGLHAKLYVADAGTRARVWTGSANATGAAFGGNVEFLVELEGKKSHCGVDAVIGQRDDGLSLRDLLETYTPRSDEPQDPTPEQRLERRLDAVRRELAGLRFTARVDSDEDDAYQLRLVGEPRAGRPIGSGWSDLEIRCRPLTLSAAYGRSVDIGSESIAVEFGAVSFSALTSFFAFEIEGRDAGLSATVAFLVNARLVGAPTDRRERVLVELLKDRSALLRFLLFLLGGEPSDQLAMELGPSLLSGVVGDDDGPKDPIEWQNLFEPMVRALARDPRQLDDIDRLVRDLRRTEEGLALLPDDWDTIWEPIRAAREELRS